MQGNENRRISTNYNFGTTTTFREDELRKVDEFVYLGARLTHKYEEEK